MAVPAYTNDLNLLSDFEGTIPALSEFTNYTAGRAPASSTDYPIQGTTHIDTIVNSIGQASCSIDNGSNITWTAGWVFFSWLVFTAPGAIATQANGGFVFIVGASTANFRAWYVGGSDFGSYPYGGWQNFAVDPTVTAQETVGTPGTNYRYVGLGVDVTPTAVAKGSPLGIDVIRYGRGTFRIANGSSGDGYATFVGMAAANDASTARWGLFQKIEGGYKCKGILYFGYGAATEFVDINKNIVIDNTEFVTSTFNRIEFHNASSVISWANINFTALGTVSKGQFEMIDNATFTDVGGVFTDMDTFIYQSNATLTGRTFRRCALVTQGGATFTSCVFDNSTATKALLVDTVALVTKCNFISDGTGYAMEGFSAAGDYTITGCTYSGYASSDGTSGNECIHVLASSGIVNLLISGGNTPTYHSAGATVNVVNAVPINIYVKDESNNAIEGASVSVYKSSDGTQLMNELSAATTGLATESVNYVTDIPVYIRVRKSSTGTRYFPINTSGTIGATGLALTVVMNADNIAIAV